MIRFMKTLSIVGAKSPICTFKFTSAQDSLRATQKKKNRRKGKNKTKIKEWKKKCDIPFDF